jgi:hypothetical protein
VLDLDDRLLADGYERFDGVGSTLHLAVRQFDRALAVVALNGVLDERRTDAAAHGAGRTVDACRAEVIGVVPTVLAAAQAVAESLAAVATKDAALEIVAVSLRRSPAMRFSSSVACTRFVNR